MTEQDMTEQKVPEFRDYKFRAEAWYDVAGILTAICDLGLSWTIAEYVCEADEFDGINVKIRANLEPTLLNKVMREVTDCHVAAESLKLAEDYDGERDDVFGLAWKSDEYQQIDRVKRHRKTLLNVFKHRLAASIGKDIQVEYSNRYPGIHHLFRVIEVTNQSFKMQNQQDGREAVPPFNLEEWEVSDNGADRYVLREGGERVKALSITFL